jgi:hypothetical protein
VFTVTKPEKRVEQTQGAAVDVVGAAVDVVGGGGGAVEVVGAAVDVVGAGVEVVGASVVDVVGAAVDVVGGGGGAAVEVVGEGVEVVGAAVDDVGEGVDDVGEGVEEVIGGTGGIGEGQHLQQHSAIVLLINNYYSILYRIMTFKEFLKLSEQAPPPPGGMGGPPPASGGVPDVSSLLKEILPRNMSKKGRLQKAIGGGKVVLVVPNLKTGKKAQNLAAASIDKIDAEDGEIGSAIMNIFPPLKGSSSREYVMKGKRAREIMGNAISDKKKARLIRRDVLNKAFSPQKISGIPVAAAASGMLPGGGLGL